MATAKNFVLSGTLYNICMDESNSREQDNNEVDGLATCDVILFHGSTSAGLNQTFISLP